MGLGLMVWWMFFFFWYGEVERGGCFWDRESGSGSGSEGFSGYVYISNVSRFPLFIRTICYPCPFSLRFDSADLLSVHPSIHPFIHPSVSLQVPKRLSIDAKVLLHFSE